MGSLEQMIVLRENIGALPTAMTLYGLSLVDLILIMAAALGCLNFNRMLKLAVDNDGIIPADFLQTIDNVFGEGSVFGEDITVVNEDVNVDVNQESVKIDESGFQRRKLTKEWHDWKIRLSPNSGSLFIGQTLLRHQFEDEIYFLSPSKSVAGANARRCLLERIFDRRLPKNATENKNPGILATLSGIFHLMFKLTIYSATYVAWPYIIACESSLMKAYPIPTRTVLAQSQQFEPPTKAGNTFCRDMEQSYVIPLINLLNEVNSIVFVRVWACCLVFENTHFSFL
jgi:hypothetical protein